MVTATSRRSYLHYLTAAGVILLYGAHVCPFLESLTYWQLLLPVAAALVTQMLIRGAVRAVWQRTGPQSHRLSSFFFLELWLFVISGVAVAVFNTFHYEFPLDSAAKVLGGFLMIGFFVATDTALEDQRRLFEHISAHRQQGTLEEDCFPVSAKLGVFATATVLILLAVMILVISKDLDWLNGAGAAMPFGQAKVVVLAELGFVALVILGYSISIIRSYSRNLKDFLGAEMHALAAAAEGKLEISVPISSNDEFGVMAKHTNAMIQNLKQGREELVRTQDITIMTLATLAEIRDNETGAHILRTQRYIECLAQELRDVEGFFPVLDDETINLLMKSAPLHDIGKVGIQDSILLKPGKLSGPEFDIMKTHTLLGAEAMTAAEKEFGSNSFLRYAKEIALTHHEKWDGSGYPHGLTGTEIPISGRLMAVADVYDALISKRVYKPAFSHEKARRIILEGSGSHFDPAVVRAFKNLEHRIKFIADQYGDQYTEAA